jgi:hypothetical protein
MDEDVFDERGGDHTQRDFAIDSAEGEVVDFISKGRNVGALRGIDIDRENVLSVEIEVRSQIERKGRVSSLVFAEARAVDPDCGSGHHPFKVDEYVLAFGRGRKLEAAAVKRDELIRFLIKAVPGKRNVRVRDDDLVELGVIEVLVVAAIYNSAAVPPLAVDGQDEASGGVCVRLRRFGNSVGCKSCAGDERAGLLQERASILVYLCPQTFDCTQLLRKILKGSQRPGKHLPQIRD